MNMFKGIRGIMFAIALLWVAHGATCPPDPWDGFVDVVSSWAKSSAVLLACVFLFMYLKRQILSRA